jgi:hypothetical protein
MSDDHRDNGRNRRQAVDQLYFEQRALRLAAACGLPLALAQRRVMALAISAQPRPNDGFLARGDREGGQ